MMIVMESHDGYHCLEGYMAFNFSNVTLRIYLPHEID